MRCEQVLWQAALLMLLTGAPGLRLYSPRRLYMPAVEMNCFEMPMKVTMVPSKASSEAWRLQKKLKLSALPTTTANPASWSGAPAPAPAQLNAHEVQRRFDHLFTEGDDIVKEHAKLVQDINSLRQVVFVAPLVDETKDYDDSVYHEIIETSSTTTTRPTTTAAPVAAVAAVAAVAPRIRAKTSGIPVYLLGGTSQRLSVKAAPALNLPPPTISLVGASSSPLARHPYPFVGQEPSAKPYRVCMPTTLPMTYTPTTRSPSLWTRLLSFFPRLTG